MSLQGFTLETATFETSRGNSRLDQDTGSSFQEPVGYNEDIPTGAALRAYAKINTSVTVIDPNGEGNCRPRLVAAASTKMSIINDLNAPFGAPFTSVTAIDGDITTILDFFATVIDPTAIPAPKPVA